MVSLKSGKICCFHNKCRIYIIWYYFRFFKSSKLPSL